jgi:hypothetical protein
MDLFMHNPESRKPAAMILSYAMADAPGLKLRWITSLPANREERHFISHCRNNEEKR